MSYRYWLVSVLGVLLAGLLFIFTVNRLTITEDYSGKGMEEGISQKGSYEGSDVKRGFVDDPEEQFDLPGNVKWVPDQQIKGNIKIIEKTDHGSVEYSGTHLLVRSRDDVSLDQISEWLAFNQLGEVIYQSESVLKISPQENSLRGFQRLRKYLDEDPQNLFKWSEPDYIYRTLVRPDDASAMEVGAWFYESIHAYDGWDTRSTASDVVVAVIDTGINYTLDELSGNLWKRGDVIGYDFVNDDMDPRDDQGHGTSVAGLIGAVGNNGKGIAGMAWDVQLMPVKVLNGYGYGLASDIVDGINFSVQNGARILNMSLGSSGNSMLLEEAVSIAGEAGVAIVCAVGNENNDLSNTPVYPAGYDMPHVVQVAAVNDSEEKAVFSNFSRSLVDIFAPGDDIRILVLGTESGGIGIEDGTSLSAPLVTGVLSLIIAEFPGETNIESIQRLLDAGRFRESLLDYSKNGKSLDLNRAVLGYQPKPPVVSWDRNEVTWEYGSYRKIEPLIESDSPVLISWIHNGNLLPDDSRVLEFYSFNESNTGTYIVEVTSSEGVTQSEPLVVNGKHPQPVIEFLTAPLITVPGNSVELKISVSYTGDFSVDWFKEGNPVPLVQGSGNYHFIADETATYYARISYPEGEILSEPIHVEVVQIELFDGMQGTGKFNPIPRPIGYYQSPDQKKDPLLWSILPEYPVGRLAYAGPEGVYYYTYAPVRMVHVDPAGNSTVSGELPVKMDQPVKVLNGYVVFPGSFEFNGVLDPGLNILENARGNLHLVRADGHNNWAYEVFWDQDNSAIGFRRTQDFEQYEMLVGALPMATGPFNEYSLTVVEDTAVLNIPNPHLWVKDGGIVELPLSVESFKKDGEIFIYQDLGDGSYSLEKFDSLNQTWEDLGVVDSDTLLTMGEGARTRIVNVPEGTVREFFDGTEWLGYWTTFNSQMAATCSTESSFYSVQEEDHRKKLYRSTDGYDWVYSGYDVNNESLLTYHGNSLVEIRDSVSKWIGDFEMFEQQLQFDGGTPQYPLSSVSKVGNGYFLFATLAYDQREVFLSFDAVNFIKTNLPFPPVRFGELEDGTYYAQVSRNGADVMFTSSDARVWDFSDSPEVEPAWYLLKEFSMGWFNGDKYSSDGTTWITTPVSPDNIIETSNRILFLDNSGNYTHYFDKTDVFENQEIRSCLPYVKNWESRYFIGQPVTLEIGWGSLFPVPVTKFELWINEELYASSTQQNPIFEFTPTTIERNLIECVVSFADGRVGQYLLGAITVNPHLSGEVDGKLIGSFQVVPVSWMDGWICVFGNRILYSDDKYHWTDLVPSDGMFGSLSKVMVHDGKILMRGNGFYSSTDGGQTWDPLQFPTGIYPFCVIDQSIVLSGEGSYSRDLLEWHKLPVDPDYLKDVRFLNEALYYLDRDMRVIRYDLLTQSFTVIDDNVMDVGHKAYLKYTETPSARVELFVLADGSSIGSFELGDDFNNEGDLKISGLKDDYVVINDYINQISGYLWSTVPEVRHVPYNLPEERNEYAHIGPTGLKIHDVSELTYANDGIPIARIRFNLLNSSYIPISKDEGFQIKFEWLDPASGNVFYESDLTMNQFIRNESMMELEMDIPAPLFQDNQFVDLRLTLSGNEPSRLKGRYQMLYEGAYISARASVSIFRTGNGKVSFESPGPYSIGSTVEVYPVSMEGFTFGYWNTDPKTAAPSLHVTVARDSSVEAVFLPIEVAAIDRWSAPITEGDTGWYAGLSKPIYRAGDKWTYSIPVKWLYGIEKDGSIYCWSPELGWTCTHTDWFPYHWIYSLNEWIRIGD